MKEEHEKKLKFYQKQYARQLKLVQQMLESEAKGIKEEGESFIPSQGIQTEFINLTRVGERLTALKELLD